MLPTYPRLAETSLAARPDLSTFTLLEIVFVVIFAIILGFVGLGWLKNLVIPSSTLRVADGRSTHPARDRTHRYEHAGELRGLRHWQRRSAVWQCTLARRPRQ
jgi:hypothetical protein